MVDDILNLQPCQVELLTSFYSILELLMRFKAAVRRLESLLNYEKKPGYDYNLDDYRQFLAGIGSPHQRLRSVILIAGTKGKGSTGMILSSLLSAFGKRVGLFNSPHLIDVRERIRINNKKIPKATFARYIKDVVARIKSPQGIRSYFEALVTIATLYFLDEAVDYAIFEVGMGGRKDATNVHRPILSIITRIGHDHERFLGRNLDQIAREKAGIIHDRAPVILARQLPSVHRIITEIAEERGSRCYYVEDELRVEILNQDLHGSHLLIKEDGEIFTCEFPLIGYHQIENLKAALFAARLLGVDRRSIQAGLRRVRVPARIEVIDSQPRVILDTAHNPQSFNALARVLPQIVSGRLIVVFGISKGKNWSILKKKILPWSYETIITKASLPRATEPAVLARKIPARIIDKVGEAVTTALDLASPEDTILITGSFYIAGEAIEALRDLGVKVQIP